MTALMLLWAAHDGGYDADTWYWGALLVVGMLAASAALLQPAWRPQSRLARVSLVAFVLYVAWSFASIAWAQDGGAALEGSNRALLYVAVFALMAALPWTAEAAIAVLLCFAIGVGVTAVVIVVRLASADHVAALLAAGRMNSPTGYYNATAALFMMDALVCCGLAARRSLPGPLRGLLLAIAGADLELTIAGQSRGWLFTLPLVLIVSLVVVRGRWRVAAAAVIPAAVALVNAHPVLRIYDAVNSPRLDSVAAHAGHEALVLFGGAFLVGTLLAWGDQLTRFPLSAFGLVAPPVQPPVQRPSPLGASGRWRSPMADHSTSSRRNGMASAASRP